VIAQIKYRNIASPQVGTGHGKNTKVGTSHTRERQINDRKMSHGREATSEQAQKPINYEKCEFVPRHGVRNTTKISARHQSYQLLVKLDMA
jgi:hypothetical protein